MLGRPSTCIKYLILFLHTEAQTNSRCTLKWPTIRPTSQSRPQTIKQSGGQQDCYVTQNLLTCNLWKLHLFTIQRSIEHTRFAQPFFYLCETWKQYPPQRGHHLGLGNLCVATRKITSATSFSSFSKNVPLKAVHFSKTHHKAKPHNATQTALLSLSRQKFALPTCWYYLIYAKSSQQHAVYTRRHENRPISSIREGQTRPAAKIPKAGFFASDSLCAIQLLYITVYFQLTLCLSVMLPRQQKH
jgi:hypothetical protein